MRYVCLLLLLLVPLPVWAATVRTAHTACGGLWSAGSTWGTGRPPEAQDVVQIDAGCTVVYDLASSPPLAEINLDGALVFALDRSTELTVSLLIVEPTGRLEIGTALQPVPPQHTATIRLIDLPEQTHTHLHGQAGMAPALHTHGGTLTLHGAPRARTWTRLGADVAAGATTLLLTEPVPDWRAGDRLIITGTQVLGTPPMSQTEEAVLAAVEGATLTLAAPLRFGHLGTAPRQAAVGLLSHNVRIVSADPVGRRGHVMIAHGFVVKDSEPLPALTNRVQASISFVEFAHLGRPEPGIYPVHFHRLGTGGRDQVFTGNSVHHSHNLCVRVHTTHFLLVAETVCYDALGHGFATEDGSEMYNTWHRNLAARTRAAVARTNPNDPTDSNEGTGFWVNNPHNALTDNYAAEPEGWGYQVDPITTGATPNRGAVLPRVDAMGAPLPPGAVTTLPLLTFAGNTAQSGGQGSMEFLNMEASTPSVVTQFQANDGQVAASATALTFAQLVTTGADMVFYTPGNNPALLTLPRPPSHQFVQSRLGRVFQTGYQYEGMLLFDQTTGPAVHKNGPGVATLTILTGTPRPAQLTVEVTNDFLPGTRTPFSTFPHDSTSQQEWYVFDADGPGQHLKLIPYGLRAADALTYRPARFTAGQPPCTPATPWYCLQEAAFSGPPQHGPPLRLPVRINAGAFPLARLVDGQVETRGQDVVDAQGRRWMTDALYVPAPPGWTLPRYGHDQATLVFLGDSTTLTGTVAGANRTATGFQPMRYLVDLPNGTYHVDLHMIETWNTGGYPYAGVPRPGWGVGTRRFDVSAQGQVVLRQLDVFAEAGGAWKALVKSFPVQVAAGPLVLTWSEFGMISGIAVCRLDQVVGGQCGGDIP